MRQIIKKVFFCLLIVLITSEYSKAQESQQINISSNKISIGGIQYYIHLVKKGQTVYSIAKAYNVSPNDIFNSNPGSEIGIQENTALKIPLNVTSTPFNNYQELESKDTTIINHITIPGDNIYRLSKQYNTSLETIYQLNPTLKDTLKVGAIVKIPRVFQPEKTFKIIHEEKSILYVIKKEDSFISLSRKFNIPLASIIKSNKQLIWGGLKEGQTINITYMDTVVWAPEIAYIDTIDSVKSNTPLFNLLTNQDPLNLNNIKQVPDSGLSLPLDIAILLPFNFKRIVELNTYIDTCENRENLSWAKRQRVRAKKITDFYTDLYLGCLIASDSLRNMGISLNINIYDTEGDSNIVRYLINKYNLKDMDLVIGPINLSCTNTLFEYLGNTDVQIVLPTLPGNIPEYTNVFQVIPSEDVFTEHLSYYLAKQSDKNIILLSNSDSLSRLETFNTKQHIMKYMEYFRTYDSAIIKEVYYNDTLTKTITHSLNTTKENLIVILSKDEAFVSNIARDLYYHKDNYKISLFGNPGWVSWFWKNNLDIDYIHELNVMYFTHFYLDYNKENVKGFLRKFRKDFRSEPYELVQGINPIIYGYDLFLFFTTSLTGLNPSGQQFNGLLSNFEFIQKTPTSKFENVSVTFISYEKDYNINVFKPYNLHINQDQEFTEKEKNIQN